MGALKAALTAIFSANTYTSSTSGIASKKIPVTESNGLPSGQIGMSDLASVLGVFEYLGSFDGDMNTLRSNVTGYLTRNSTATNAPDIATTAGACFCVIQNFSYPIQIVIGKDVVAFRNFLYSQWGAWKILQG